MAKGILRFFGGATILVGFLTILVGLLTPSGQGLFITVPIGAGFLISGAPLLGFAYVIELLEQIARNTASQHSYTSPQATLALAENLNGALTTASPVLEYEPRQGDHSVTQVVERAAYRGQEYRRHTDGMVTARLRDGPYTWRDFQSFTRWIDAQPRSA